MKLKLLAASAAVALGLLGAGAANALTTVSLGAGNTDISGFPAPYGSVSINLLTPTTATVTFTTDNVGAFHYFFIDSSAADVNVNATSWTITNFADVTAISSGGSGNVDGFGVFNQTTNQADGFGSPSTSISFLLTDTGTTTWSSSANVLTPNASGDFVAAHIAVCDTTSNPTCGSGGTGAIATGFAAGSVEINPTGGGGGGVPEPAAWGLMILGFGGIGAALRMQRRQRAQLA